MAEASLLKEQSLPRCGLCPVSCTPGPILRSQVLTATSAYTEPHMMDGWLVPPTYLQLGLKTLRVFLTHLLQKHVPYLQFKTQNSLIAG